MNDLQAAQALLSAAMLSDPALALANVVAWLDPHPLHTNGFDGVQVGTDEEDQAVGEALDVCRRCFPEVYAQVSQLVWLGADFDTLDRQICAGISRHLVTPLQDLEAIAEGVPIDARGVELAEPDFYAFNPDLAAVLADFGINADTFEVGFQFARDVAVALIHSLEKHRGNTYADLAALLGWLFSATGNTLIDFTNNDIWENGYEPIEWTLENVAFINDVTLEAIGHVASAQDAAQTLQEDAELRAALRRNVEIASRQLEAGRKENQVVRTLRWPERP